MTFIVIDGDKSGEDIGGLGLVMGYGTNPVTGEFEPVIVSSRLGILQSNK